MGPRLDPIATPSICRYMMLLKLNLTEEVAKLIRCLKTLSGKVGLGRELQNRTSQQISIVSSRGAFVCIKRTNVKGAHKHISWTEVSDNFGKRKRIFNTETTKVLQHRLKH